MLINYPSVLQHLPDGVLLLDNEGLVLYANRTLETLTGLQPADLYRLHFSTIYPSGDAMKASFELAQAQKKGSFAAEGWKMRKDGSKFWCQFRINALEEVPGAAFICTLQDVTERKQQEWRLKESEERYRLMVEGVRDYAIFLLDPEGHIVTWNEGAARTKGYSANEIIGRHFSTFYTAVDLDDKKPERELRIAVATGKYEEEGWRVKKNGSVFWANVVITALFNDNNRLIGFSKVTRDLTERREADERLRLSEERYRLLVEQVTDYGIFMLDERGRIVSWNEGAARINGYGANEVIGKYFSLFYPEEDVLGGKPVMELEVARREGKYEEEGWRIRKDGSPFWANVVITAVYNRDAVLIGYSKVTRDLSERKAAERALQESTTRYRLLAEALKIANDELSAANAELEQFNSIVSHDLQEPLRTIRSFLQLIGLRLEEQQYGDIGTYVSRSLAAANRMRELIRNLLHYSQLSRNEINWEPIQVDQLFSEALQNLRTAIDTSGAEVSIRNEVDEIHGDRVQLVQLVQNLLSNALKFTISGTPCIEIRCTRGNGQVRFAVSDNGIGIARGDLQKVFEIFRRLHTERSYPGTGIGLAICKKIVDRHQGEIWPESEPGNGTTFYFTLKDEAGRLLTP